MIGVPKPAARIALRLVDDAEIELGSGRDVVKAIARRRARGDVYYACIIRACFIVVVDVLA